METAHENQYTVQNPQCGKTKAEQPAELGKRCAEMEKASADRGNQYGKIRSAELAKSKADQLAELGFTRHDISRCLPVLRFSHCSSQSGTA